jgi:hypothetical protein
MVPVCPVRSEASHRSEQTSQLLFGEFCTLLERKEDFVRIKVSDDDYEGWCQATQLEEIDYESSATGKLAEGWVSKLNMNGVEMYVPFASSLAFISDENYKNTKNIIYHGGYIHSDAGLINDAFIKKIAFTFLNTPYLWGGRSVFGIDCSGFTQLVFKCINIALPRDAYQQAAQGEAVVSLERAKCGDLAFFNNLADRVVHVGILLNSNMIIHASGKVRIDAMDAMGIVSSDTGKHTHDLKAIKRLIGVNTASNT